MSRPYIVVEIIDLLPSGLVQEPPVDLLNSQPQSLWIWFVLGLLFGYALLRQPKSKAYRVFFAACVFLFLSQIFLPPIVLKCGGLIFCAALVWSLHKVPIHFVLGFYYRWAFKRFNSKNIRIQGYGSIFSMGWLGVVVQKSDLSELSLSYTTLFTEGLHLSNDAPITEWVLSKPHQFTHKEVVQFESQLIQLPWFQSTPTPSVWIDSKNNESLVVRGVLLRSKDYATVMQIFYRHLEMMP
jgi:hypothetical protein